jgi:hypothetical protein
MAEPDYDEMMASEILKTVYTSLSSLSRGLENNVTGVQRLVGMLRSLPENETSAQLADIFATVSEGLGENLAFVATIQDRIRKFAPEGMQFDAG